MGGRADYEERKQRRIERYKIVSQKEKKRNQRLEQIQMHKEY